MQYSVALLQVTVQTRQGAMLLHYLLCLAGSSVQLHLLDILGQGGLGGQRLKVTTFTSHPDREDLKQKREPFQPHKVRPCKSNLILKSCYFSEIVLLVDSGRKSCLRTHSVQATINNVTIPMTKQICFC